MLNPISKRFDACQRTPNATARFHASLPTEEGLIFEEELSIDFMFLDGKAFLHVVDTATCFSAVNFLGSTGPDCGLSVKGN